MIGRVVFSYDLNDVLSFVGLDCAGVMFVFDCVQLQSYSHLVLRPDMHAVREEEVPTRFSQVRVGTCGWAL